MTSSDNQSRKAKINLNDYPFQRDIKFRLLIANLNAIEVEVLREIIHHSLKISIEQLASDLDLEIASLISILDKLSVINLFKRQNMVLTVDKEMRKYFEAEIEKFDDHFRPDIDFLQTILSKVPINVLLLWYAIPRSSDNIFESIIETYFITPKIYRQYLSEIQFDDPIFKSIIQEVYRSPDFMVSVDHLITKFNLTHACLEEYLLFLEYHFVCCLSYKRIEGKWKEIVTPFAEWRDLLKFEYLTKLHPLPETSIKKDQLVEFAFIKDLQTLLQIYQSKKTPQKNIKNLHATSHDQQEILLKKLIQLDFIKPKVCEKNKSHISPERAEENSVNNICLTKKGKEWLVKCLPEQVTALANDPLNQLPDQERFSSLWNISNLRLIEKSLRRLPPKAWVLFDNFFQGMILPIGNKKPITLQNKSKKWQYVLPIYSENETVFIQTVIMKRLSELGIVETGLYQESPCFCVTPFGYQLIH